MKPKEVIFRVDGSVHKGTGHLVRCLSIAQELKKKNVKSTFFSHHSPLQVSMVSDYRHEVYYQRGYSGEITISRLIKEHIKSNPAAGIIVDLPPDLNRKEALSYLGMNIPTIALDDHGAAKKHFATVINSIAHPDHQEKMDSSQQERFFRGPDYMILTDEKQVVAKQWNIDSNKILIAMGGSDPYNITLKALKAISGLKTRLEIHLLLGPGYRFLGSLEDVRRNIYQPLHFHHGIPQEGLPSFLAGFKLAIMSFGLTVYSAARAGLPVICLAHHPQGAEAARTFFKDQATGKFIGEQSQVPGESIARETIKLLENNNALRRFSQNGQETVDGKGLERVVNIIMSRIS